MDFNWVSHHNVVLSATSENPNFPASNVAHNFRSKVWRSTGHFEIDDNNKFIDFREVALGPEITATLLKGHYTLDELATEIKTRLDAYTLNARTYTVSYDVLTFKWTITGQTYLELLTNTGTYAATSIYNDIGFDLSADYTGGLSYVGTNNAIHNYEALTIDLMTEENVDSLALIWDRRTGSNLSSAAVITFQGNSTLNWDSPAVDEVVTLDGDKDLATKFLPVMKEMRYWRVKIEDPANLDGYVELGVVFLSGSTSFKCPDNGFKYLTTDKTNVNKNDYGNVYADKYPKMKRLEFAFKNAEYDPYFKDIEAIFWRVGNSIPICVWFDPEQAMFDEHQFFIYGRFISQLDYDHSFYTRFNLPLTIEEIF